MSRDFDLLSRDFDFLSRDLDLLSRDFDLLSRDLDLVFLPRDLERDLRVFRLILFDFDLDLERERLECFVLGVFDLLSRDLDLDRFPFPDLDLDRLERECFVGVRDLDRFRLSRLVSTFCFEGDRVLEDFCLDRESASNSTIGLIPCSGSLSRSETKIHLQKP